MFPAEVHSRFYRLLVTSALSSMVAAAIGIGIALTIRKFEIFVPYLAWEIINSQLYVAGTTVLTALFFLPFLGKVKESRRIIFSFAVLSFVIAQVQVFIGLGQMPVLAGRNCLRSEMMDTMSKYNDTAEVQCSWDTIQHDLNCCGVTNATDWNITTIVNLPSSCCIDLPSEEMCSLAKASKEGCHSPVIHSLRWKLGFMGLVTVIIAMIQTYCGVASIYLSLKDHRAVSGDGA